MAKDFAFRSPPETRDSDAGGELRRHVTPTDARDAGPMGLDKYLSAQHGTPERGHGGYKEVARHHGYEVYEARAGGKRGVLWQHPSGAALTFESDGRGPERTPTRANRWHSSIKK